MQLTVKEFKNMLKEQGIEDRDKIASIQYVADDEEDNVVVWTTRHGVMIKPLPSGRPDITPRRGHLQR